MKFTKLSSKFARLLNKKKSGKTIKPEKVEKLRLLLTEKESRFEEKMHTTLTTEKRQSIQTKLKVVQAQLKKLNSLN